LQDRGHRRRPIIPAGLAGLAGLAVATRAGGTERAPTTELRARAGVGHRHGRIGPLPRIRRALTSVPASQRRDRRAWLRAAAGAAGLLLGSGAARAQFRVEISGVGATQLPVAIAAFRGEARAPQPLSAIVRADLARSGLFRLLDAPDALDETSAPDLPAWKARGADALVAGSITPLADGRYDIRFRLWDAVKGESMAGRGSVVPAEDLRLAAHRIADEIHQQLTGEAGVNATRIAYVVKAGRRFTLHVADADGEGGRVALASNEPIISPTWAPDGRALAYVSFELQKAVVWVQDLASGERRVLANFRGSNSAPAFSPDGQQLAVALSREGSTQLFVMPRGGGTPRRLATSPAIDTEPVWSPDGRFVYFTSDRGGAPQIYRIAAGGGGGAAERITFRGEFNISPAISPDGRLLAFVSRQGGAFRVVTQELESGTVTTLTDTADDESPSFAPNGRLIVYATRVQARDVLMTTTLDGKIKTRLVTSGSDMREPAWGPSVR
jgi:TolB protein